jgi:hypothetical protein
LIHPLYGNNTDIAPFQDNCGGTISVNILVKSNEYESNAVEIALMNPSTSDASVFVEPSE